MGWNGSGTFNRIYSWVADKAAGLDISSSRMDTDTDDIASNGFGNCLTRDGQGQPTANLPMAGFRHTGVQNAVNRSDYSALGQAQDGLIGWTIATGTGDAIAATYTPSQGVPVDGQIYGCRVPGANATTTPTFAPNGNTARTITKLGGTALVAGDIPGNLAECFFRYNAANTRYELLNPAYPNANITTGDVKLTLKTTADTGWILFDDGTFGSATSGSSNSNSAANLALFTLFFNNLSDTASPLLTSTGSPTTRAGQGTAAAAWAANCRMTLNKTLGRALAVAGAGSGLTSRALGSVVGEETHLLTLGETPTGITSANGSQSITVSPSQSIPSTNGTISDATFAAGSSHVPQTSTVWSGTPSITGNNSISVTSTNTSGGAHNNMQPTGFFNAMVKQ